MTPANSTTPKPMLSNFTVRYRPTDASKVIYGYGVVESYLKRLMTLTWKRRSEPRNEKLDLIGKSKAALNDSERHEAIKVLLCPRTLDIFLVGKDGSLVRAQTSPPDYRHLVDNLEAAARKEMIK